MKREGFDFETATEVTDEVNGMLNKILFRQSKNAAPRKAKEVKLPAALMGDDFFAGC